MSDGFFDADHGAPSNPKKADLEIWRPVFAPALRDRGAEAEAKAGVAYPITR